MAARVRVFGAAQIEGQAPLGRRDRVVLAALVVSWSSALSAAGLAEALYGEEPPQTWRKVVQGSVARLRQLLGPRTIETTPDGYRLTIGDDDVDVRLFERLLRQAVELSEVGQPAGAIAPLRDALGLFRGEPLADLDGWMPGREEAGRLAELGRLGEERLVAVLLADGRVDEAATAAASLADRQPLREQRWVLLAEALYRSDRQADALRSIERARRLLREELGVDPGPALMAIERAVLEHDQTLEAGAERRRVVAACPYKGLAVYGIEDADAFFGRDADISAGVNRLSQTGVLAIVGPSGSGKSSLARAGVAPALRRSGRQVVVFTPGTDPVGQLRSVPASAAIVVDQLEELFTLTVDAGQRLAFSELLAARAVTAPVVLTLRADFVAAVGGVPPLAELVETGMQLLGPMGEAQLRAAITEPAIRAGLRLEPGLVDLLIRDVEGQSGALPLLSHALAETWARREDWVLTVAGYRAGGGVQGAVAATADRVVDHLPPEGRRISRSIFLRLVSLSDAGAPVSHRLARADLARDEPHAQVLDALLASRLLMANAETVEVTHEALGRAWPRLRTWLDEDRDGQRIFRHLATTAAEWERTGRDEADLYRGGRLRTAEEWVVIAKPDLTKVEHEFLDASTARRQSEEADLAAQAVATRRTNRRLHRALVGVGALLVLAILAGLTAFAAQRRASSEERAASHRALVSNSVALRTNKRDLAALLAIEAHRLGPSAATESALFGTFTSALGLERSVKAEAQIVDGIQGESVLLDSDTMLLPGHGTVHAVDIETGTETYRLELVPDDEGGFIWLSATPDRRYLATAWRRGDTNPGRGVVNVWDLASRQKRFDDIEVPFSMGAVAISPDASYVAIGGGRDARILIYDGATGAFLREIRPIAPPPDAHLYISTVALTFTPAGELIVGSQVGPIRFIDPGSGEEVRRIKGFPERAEEEIRLSSDGLALLTHGWRGLMRYETTSGRPLWAQPTEILCGPLALLERDGLVLCGDDTGVVTEIDLGTGSVLGPRPGREAGVVCGLLDSPEQSTLVETTCRSTEYVLWRLDGGGAASQLVAPVTGEHFVGHYLADGRVVVELPGEGEERVTNLIDVGSGDLQPLPGIWAPASTDEPGIVAASFDDGTGGVFDLATGQRVGPSIDLGPSFSESLRMGQLALIMGGSYDGDEVSGYLRAVDRSGATVFERQEPRVVFRAAAADDDHLVTLDCTSGGCNLQPRDPQTGAPLREALGEPGDGPSALAAAGGTLVAVWANGDVRVLDPDTLESVGGPLPGLSGGAAEVKLSDDGRRLLILLREGSLRLYDVPSRTQLGDPIPLGTGEAGAAFRPDGLEAAVGTDHGIVVWDLDPEQWVQGACAIAGRNLTRAEWDQYVGDLAPYRLTCPEFSAEA